MHAQRKALRIGTSFLLVAAVVAGGLTSGAFMPDEAKAQTTSNTVVYNIYATDGYHTMADGVQLYSYGFIGGRSDQPLRWLDKNGNLMKLMNGVATPALPTDTDGDFTPAPTGGAIQPTEAALAGNAQVPGPLMYASVGDIVEIRLKNLGVTVKTAPNDPHSIHLHGVDTDAANDGVPETSVAAVPANAKLPGAGNVVVYMFTAAEASTYMYHCHQEADIHVTMGMYGALVIYNPGDAGATGGPGAGAGSLFGFNYDRDMVMLLTETDVRQHKAEQRAGAAGGFNPVDYNPQYWFINGLSFPNTVHAALPGTGFIYDNWLAAYKGYETLVYGSTGNGDKLLVRLVNLGFEAQPMHIHGFHPKIIGGDQRAWPWANTPGETPFGEGLEKNTFLIGSGETYELLIDFSQQQVSSTYEPGVQSKMNAAGQPVVNTDPNGVAIPDPFNPGFSYIGGPTVTGVVGHPDAVSQYFPWHNHDDYKSTNNGVYPGGQFTLVRIDP